MRESEISVRLPTDRRRLTVSVVSAIAVVLGLVMVLPTVSGQNRPIGVPPPFVTKAMIGGGGHLQGNLVAVSFAPMFGDGTGIIGEPDKLTPIAQDGTLMNFRVHLQFAPGVGNSVVVTVRQDQLDTHVRCTVADLDTSCTATGDTLTFGAGQLISVKAESSSAAFGAFRWVALYAIHSR